MSDLHDFRSQIDTLDRELIEVLAKRFAVVQKIGEWKKTNNHQTRDSNRYQQMVDERKSWAQELGVSEKFIEKIVHAVHEESVNLQQKK